MGVVEIMLTQQYLLRRHLHTLFLGLSFIISPFSAFSSHTFPLPLCAIVSVLLMDSWSYGRSVFLPNGTFLPSDEDHTAMAGFEHELENDHLLMPDLAANPNGFTAVSTTKLASSSPSLLQEENQSKFSRIDFRLGSFLNYGNDDTSSRPLALPSKKPRASNLCSQKPLCQVYGCNMDLSSSKDYHKRHRVCEAHSKTSVVIVSGIEQRFCQQCSRFHFLSEFDNGKRSCRRRLAGHNERRRKPSFYFLQGKRHKPQESFPGSFLYRVMDEPDHHRASRLVSFKDEPTCSMFPGIGQNSSRTYESKPAVYSPETSGVSSVWDLHEAAPHSICALSLLSAQSQQQRSQLPDKTFSITHPNQTLNHSTKPLWVDPSNPICGSSSCSGKRSSTVDLLQLSSHLQRIEQQRNFTDEVKQEYSELYFPGS